MSELKKKGDELEKKKVSLDNKVNVLQEKIAALKSDYALLIGEKENIKTAMIKVKEKVERSQQLL